MKKKHEKFEDENKEPLETEALAINCAVENMDETELDKVIESSPFYANDKEDRSDVVDEGAEAVVVDDDEDSEDTDFSHSASPANSILAPVMSHESSQSTCFGEAMVVDDDEDDISGDEFPHHLVKRAMKMMGKTKPPKNLVFNKSVVDEEAVGEKVCKRRKREPPRDDDGLYPCECGCKKSYYGSEMVTCRACKVKVICRDCCKQWKCPDCL